MKKTETIGLGLSWPESFNALVEHYGGYREVASVLGLARKTAHQYAANTRYPKAAKTRQKFFDYGWTVAELPVRITDTPYAERATTVRRRSEGPVPVGEVTFSSLMADRLLEARRQ